MLCGELVTHQEAAEIALDNPALCDRCRRKWNEKQRLERMKR